MKAAPGAKVCPWGSGLALESERFALGQKGHSWIKFKGLLLQQRVPLGAKDHGEPLCSRSNLFCPEGDPFALVATLCAPETRDDEEKYSIFISDMKM